MKSVGQAFFHKPVVDVEAEVGGGGGFVRGGGSPPCINIGYTVSGQPPMY